MKYDNILFVFNSGRKQRIDSNKLFPNDFFYYYFHIKNLSNQTDLIEISEEPHSSIIRTFIGIFEKFFIKFMQLPFYGSKLLTFKNLKKIVYSKTLIFTNETIGYSFLFIPFIFRKKNTIIFNMGLLNNYRKNKAYDFIIFLYLKKYKKHIFLSESEYNLAKNNFKKFSSKFYYLPFTVDENFWSTTNTKRKKEYILFVGSDKNRDYELLVNISKELKNLNFKFVTSRLKKVELPNNVELIDSDWRTSKFSDLELKKVYEDAALSIIPTKYTTQPSGQSVLLQSINMGVPVMISYFDNFWGKKYFSDKKDIIFITKKNHWVNEINSYLEQTSILDEISRNALKKVKLDFNQNKIFSEFINIVNS